MIYLTKEEKSVLLGIGLVLFFGVCFQYVFKVHPRLGDMVNALESDRFYPKLDLNRATLDELIVIPQVGPALAQRIVEFRSQNGNFQDLEELKKVFGIGPAKYQILIKYLKPLP